MADPIPYVVTESGESTDAPSGAIPVALYGAPLALLADLAARVTALEEAAP